MASSNQNIDPLRIHQLIDEYKRVYPRYERSAQYLNQILVLAAKKLAPQAIIQTRPKSIPSFTEKSIRKIKAGRYQDPLMRMTDLCGGRVITQTLEEVHQICDFIEKHFVVDVENTVDVSQRLKPSEFGYRSVHYIVQFKPGIFPTPDIQMDIPNELYPDQNTPMKSEIQVRTVLEHAWAGFVHDRVYKSAFVVPPKWERQLAALAGMIEQIDQSFSRVQTGLKTYIASYGAYMNEDQLISEMDILQSVLQYDPENTDLAYRIGKLAMELGDWQKAIDIFQKYVNTNSQPILRDLGVVLCKINKQDPQGEAYRQGQKYLEMANSMPDKDPDALASLAGTWKTLNEEDKVRDLYRQAFEADSSDPYAVSNYLVYEILHQKNMDPARLMSPSIKAALHRCIDQAEVGMNLPWAFYNLGVFHLLLNQPYESLSAYLKAIEFSTTDWMAETSLQLLEKLSIVQAMIEGYDWVTKLLVLCRAVKFQDQKSLQKIRAWASIGYPSITTPVTIFVGSTNSDSDFEYIQNLFKGVFRDLQATIIGGGTTAGISALAGHIQEKNPDSIFSIGYIPGKIPGNIPLDKNYKQFRKTEGVNFSPLEPLKYWCDLITNGILSSEVKILGLGGGQISGFEYRLALTLGAQVGVFESSGREAARICSDPNWKNNKNLIKLEDDPNKIRDFIL